MKGSDSTVQGPLYRRAL